MTRAEAAGAEEALLARSPGVDAWIVRRDRGEERQRYLVGGDTSAERSVASASTQVTVYRQRDGRLGKAEITLTAGERLTAARVAEAVFRAGLAGNPPYPLPGPRPLPASGLSDPELALPARARTALDDAAGRVAAALAREPGVRCASLELFAGRSQSRLTSSTGVEATREGTSLLLELVLVARDGGDEAESYGQYEARRMADLDLEAIVARHAARARDSLRPRLPRPGTRPVLITDFAFLPLYEPFLFATSAGAVYRKLSPAAIGRPLLGERAVTGDRLTLVSDPTLAHATGSSPFDDEGLALAPLTLVEDGVVRALAADSQFGHYLGVPATGDLRNAVVAPGTLAVAELAAATAEAPLLHIVEFSWLNPDVRSGRFTTEIRLGYELSGSERRPVKGGSLAGDAYAAFAAARLSRERALFASHLGPVGIRFEALEVSAG